MSYETFDSNTGNSASKADAGSAPKKKKGRSSQPSKAVAPNWFRLGYLIHDVSRMRRTLFDQYMKPEGVTRSQWWILANLSRHEEVGVMSSELAKMLDVGKVTLGGLIERLEVAGYVYRRPDKKDKRAKRIYITQSGYALIDRMRVITEDLNKRMCDGITYQEIEEIEHKLIQIKSNIKEMLTDDQTD